MGTLASMASAPKETVVSAASAVVDQSSSDPSERGQRDRPCRARGERQLEAGQRHAGDAVVQIEAQAVRGEPDGSIDEQHREDCRRGMLPGTSIAPAHDELLGPAQRLADVAEAGLDALEHCHERPPLQGRSQHAPCQEQWQSGRRRPSRQLRCRCVNLVGGAGGLGQGRGPWNAACRRELRMIAFLVAALTLDPCAIVHARARLPALLVRRGLPAGDVEMGFITYVVPTSAEWIVVDPAVGAGTPRHAQRAPLWVRAMLPDFSRVPSVGEVLRGAHLRAVLVTHLHWDHVSGAGDLPGLRVFAPSTTWPGWDGCPPARRIEPRWRGARSSPSGSMAQRGTASRPPAMSSATVPSSPYRCAATRRGAWDTSCTAAISSSATRPGSWAPPARRRSQRWPTRTPARRRARSRSSTRRAARTRSGSCCPRTTCAPPLTCLPATSSGWSWFNERRRDAPAFRCARVCPVGDFSPDYSPRSR